MFERTLLTNTDPKLKSNFICTREARVGKCVFTFKMLRSSLLFNSQNYIILYIRSSPIHKYIYVTRCPIEMLYYNTALHVVILYDL